MFDQSKITITPRLEIVVRVAAPCMRYKFINSLRIRSRSYGHSLRENNNNNNDNHDNKRDE